MKEDEDIKVNRRKNDKIYFESPLIQSIADSIDFLREETAEILKELDSTELKQQIDELDIEELSQDTINQVTDIVDDLAQFKDEIINEEDIPEPIVDSTNDFKAALNRDDDYVRRAKRRLMTEGYDNNSRIIRLCDKAIAVNYRNWEAYYIKGIALYNLERFGEANDQFIKSLALNEDNINARLYLANSYRLNREFEDAIDVYDSVLAIDENSFDAFKGKAYTYYNCEDYEKACEFFEKANSIEPLDSKSEELWDETKNN